MPSNSDGTFLLEPPPDTFLRDFRFLRTLFFLDFPFLFLSDFFLRGFLLLRVFLLIIPPNLAIWFILERFLLFSDLGAVEKAYETTRIEFLWNSSMSQLMVPSCRKLIRRHYCVHGIFRSDHLSDSLHNLSHFNLDIRPFKICLKNQFQHFGT